MSNDYKTIQDRLLSLLYNDPDQIKSDMRVLQFHKSAYEQMYKKMTANPKTKKAVIEDVEDAIVSLEETLAIAENKLYSISESSLSVSDVN